MKNPNRFCSSSWRKNRKKVLEMGNYKGQHIPNYHNAYSDVQGFPVQFLLNSCHNCIGEGAELELQEGSVSEDDDPAD